MSRPYLVGSQTSNNSATTVITPTAATGAGATILVAACVSSAGTVTGVTDSASNVYTQQASSTTENPTYVWVSPGLTGGSGGGPTGALSVSSAITVSWSGESGTQIAAAAGNTGLLRLDQVPATTSAASGTAASITSGSLTASPEACVAVAVNGNTGGGSGTWAAGWTVLLTPTLAGSGGQYLTLATQAVPSAAPVTASFTLGSSSKWAMALLTFAALPASTGSALPALAAAGVL